MFGARPSGTGSTGWSLLLRTALQDGSNVTNETEDILYTLANLNCLDSTDIVDLAPHDYSKVANITNEDNYSTFYNLLE